MRVRNQQNKQHQIIQNAVAGGFTKSISGNNRNSTHILLGKNERMKFESRKAGFVNYKTFIFLCNKKC